MKRDMKTILIRLFTFIMLMVFSVGVDAKIKVDLGGEKNDGVYPGGTIVEKSQTEPNANGLVTVTITVTPNKSFTIKQTDIVVVSTYSPDGSDTRSPRVAGDLTLLGTDPKDLSESRDYTFVVGSSLGAWIKEAKFENKRDGAKGGDATGITSLSDITDPAGSYKITDDIDASSFTTIASFSGTLEADIDPTTNMPYRIKNLSAPLFTTLTGTVRNLVLEDVNISGGTDVGAIACNMTGTSTNIAVIYNCGILSGSVSGSGKVGGLVGVLGQEGNTTETNNNCYARVINCYSFADINGGSVKAGIVGYNCFASKYNNLRSMVMNCMFYGDIDYSSGSVSPIYSGLEISNDYNANTANRLNNYNYFLYEAPFSEGRHVTIYNCALAAEERFLVRFEFYRHLLNSTRELAAWYATGSATQSNMLKWVLETADRTIANPKPYPILKVQDYYPSIINIDADNAPSLTLENDKPKEEDRNKGGKLGTKTLSVTIYTKSQKTDGGQSWPTDASSDVQTTSLTFSRTDKDFDRFNFNYDKVQLPYYNDVGTGNYTEKRVVTGWKIVDVRGGTKGERKAADFTTTTNYDAPNYNFADRDTYAKDLYSISGRIFAQGAYFNVPKGVTGITIEPYWAVCTYLSDSHYDSYNYKDGGDLSFTSGSTTLGTRYTNNTNYSINGSSQIVYTSASNAISNLNGVTSPTVYDYAVVLVGNYHACGEGEVSDGNTPFTIMSIDNNRDNEPDYSLIFRSAKNKNCSQIRYDFLSVPSVAMAHKMSSSTNLAIPGNAFYKGWLEVTTTALIQFNQLEYSAGNTALSPLILMGGVVEQIVSTNNNNSSGNKRYLLFGDNVWFKRFANGIHGDKTGSTPHRPISVTGGEYEKFYLTGYFRPDATVLTDNAECYIDGGKFGEVAGAGQEQIGGNVDWFVNHADIDEFYGGGINESKPILGNITNTISNSRITQFCGGPKFGNMNTEKTVITTANTCTFGSYYGAGYGGNAIYLHRVKNEYQNLNWPWNNWVSTTYDAGNNANYRGKFTNDQGVAIGYEYEFFAGSSGNVARLYIQQVSFSLAQTNNVSSTLTDCIVLNNFYGGGKLGKVVGDVTSILTNCKVKGNVFGAGYSATKDDVEVLDLGGFTPVHNYNQTTGIYELGQFPAKVNYTWKQVMTSINNGAQCLEDAVDGHYIKTTANLDISNLGSVDGDVNLTIDGNSVIGTEGDSTKGNVYGGGEASYVTGSDHTVTVNLQGTAEVYGNVFGGGDSGVVEGSTVVNLE